MNSTHETSEHQALLEGLLGAAATRALAYLRDSPGWPVAPGPPAVDALSEIDQPLPHAPARPAVVPALLDRVGDRPTVVTTGGRYFGFVNGGALPPPWRRAGWRVPGIRKLRECRPLRRRSEDVARAGARLLRLAAAARWSTAPRARQFHGAAAACATGPRRDVERDGLPGAPPLTVGGRRSARLRVEGAALWAGPWTRAASVDA